jgi:hypothetical protein
MDLLDFCFRVGQRCCPGLYEEGSLTLGEPFLRLLLSRQETTPIELFFRLARRTALAIVVWDTTADVSKVFDRALRAVAKRFPFRRLFDDFFHHLLLEASPALLYLVVVAPRARWQHNAELLLGKKTRWKRIVISQIQFIDLETGDSCFEEVVPGHWDDTAAPPETEVITGLLATAAGNRRQGAKAEPGAEADGGGR